jgi:hypothetical protein
LRIRAAQAEHCIRQGAESAGRDGISADVTHPIAAVIELGHGTLCPRQDPFERVSNADVGQSAYGLGGPIADPFAKPLRAPQLGTARERRQTRAGGVAASLELSPNSFEIQVIASSCHRRSLSTIGGGQSDLALGPFPLGFAPR